MSERILITGGAGFIGSHLAQHLLREGHEVGALDRLDPQIHPGRKRPAHLDDEVELIEGDIRDPAAVADAVEGFDAVIHLAARDGAAQSMHEIAYYCSVNTVGTGVLLEALMEKPVRRLVVASSMSVYGEGLYMRVNGETYEGCERSPEELERGQWEPLSPNGNPLKPQPTPESKQPRLSSVYALNKYDQERMCLLFGSSYDVPTTALRFFNVFGPGQAPSNPYAGALTLFGDRLLEGRAPIVFEDGGQRRDFVSVHDAARACVLALERDEAAGQAINVGSGESVTVLEAALRLAWAADRQNIRPKLTHTYRAGDVRHCFADISLAREVLGYEPQVALDDGMAELAAWLEGQPSVGLPLLSPG